MGSNLTGIILSFIFIFGLIGVSTLGRQQHLLSSEGSRKLIHIGVCHWWLIAMVFFDSPAWASVIPASFLGLNYWSYKTNLFSAMERRKGHGDLGTVYYPISLLILALLSFGPLEPYFGALGILLMGYGDGWTAVVGEKWGENRFTLGAGTKSLEGTLTMFLVSLGISMRFFWVFTPNGLLFKSLVTALAATALEAFSPLGLGNLTVPLGVSSVYYLLFYQEEPCGC